MYSKRSPRSCSEKLHSIPVMVITLLFVLILIIAVSLQVWSYPDIIPEKGYNDTYTWHRAKNYLMYSYAAYCQPFGLQNWDCLWCKNTTEVPNIKYVFYSPITNTYGYIGYNQREIIVAFRGTQFTSYINWEDDLDVDKTVYPYAGIPGAEVHSGFYDAYMSVKPQVIPAIISLHNSFPSLPIVFVGHSLGGALSTLAVVDASIYINIPPVYVKFYVWNYGSPRVGNQIFANYFRNNIETLWRTVNQRDFIPHLPPRNFGFWHVPTEVWYPSNFTSFVICDSSGEDPNCSDSLYVDDGMTDHYTYLGFDERLGYGC